MRTSGAVIFCNFLACDVMVAVTQVLSRCCKSLLLIRIFITALTRGKFLCILLSPALYELCRKVLIVKDGTPIKFLFSCWLIKEVLIRINLRHLKDLLRFMKTWYLFFAKKEKKNLIQFSALISILVTYCFALAVVIFVLSDSATMLKYLGYQVVNCAT